MKPARSRDAWNGVLAAVAGYAVAFLVGLATNRPFVANAIANRIMEATPVSLASVLLATLGIAAKPFALAGALALVAAMGALSGKLLRTPSPVAAMGALSGKLLRTPSPVAAMAALSGRLLRTPSPLAAKAALSGKLQRTPSLLAAKAALSRRLLRTPSLLAAMAALSGKLLRTPSPVATGEGRGEGTRPSRAVRLAVLAIAQAGLVVLLAGPEHAPEVLLPYAIWLLTIAALTRQPEPSRQRRWFLQRGFQTAASLVLLSTATTWTLLAKTLAGAQPGKLLFPFQPPAPRQAEFAAVDGLTPEVTPITSFYLMSKTVEDPAVAVDTWRLRIGGQVRRQLDLTYEDLMRLPRIDQWLTLRCVSNPVGGPLISNALWSGAPLPSLLSLAEIAPEATTLVLKGRDTYSDSIPLNRALLDSTLVAYAVNGGLLNRDHGFPARVLVPGLYGFKNVKWVEELQLVAGDFNGPWQRLGWTKTAIQTTFSRIDFVRRSASGALAGGIAFAGDRGIRAVEVLAGDQPWRQAQLHTPPLGNLAWVQWLFPFQASGRTTVTVRATDGAGAVQEQTERGIFPDGATGWHTVTAEL